MSYTIEPEIFKLCIFAVRLKPRKLNPWTFFSYCVNYSAPLQSQNLGQSNITNTCPTKKKHKLLHVLYNIIMYCTIRITYGHYRTCIIIIIILIIMIMIILALSTVHWGLFSVPSYENEWYWQYLMTGRSSVVSFHNRVYGCSGVQPTKYPCTGEEFTYVSPTLQLTPLVH